MKNVLYVVMIKKSKGTCNLNECLYVTFEN